MRGRCADGACRTHTISRKEVALPLLITHLANRWMDAATAKVRLGGIASLAVLAYALGKFISGALAIIDHS
jgi:hypothetical protein